MVLMLLTVCLSGLGSRLTCRSGDVTPLLDQTGPGIEGDPIMIVVGESDRVDRWFASRLSYMRWYPGICREQVKVESVSNGGGKTSRVWSLSDGGLNTAATTLHHVFVHRGS